MQCGFKRLQLYCGAKFPVCLPIALHEITDWLRDEVDPKLGEKARESRQKFPTQNSHQASQPTQPLPVELGAQSGLRRGHHPRDDGTMAAVAVFDQERVR